jgi:hypothetical protein
MELGNKKNYDTVDPFLSTVANKMGSPDLNTLNKFYTQRNHPIDKKEISLMKSHFEMKNKNPRRNQEKNIFYEIFIRPTENKIQELREKQEEKKLREMEKNVLDDIDGGTDLKKIKTEKNDTESPRKHTNKKSTISDVLKIKFNEIKIKEVFKKDEYYDTTNVLFKFLADKFIPDRKCLSIDDKKNNNYFNQLIQIKPPEGINALVASPILGCKF